MNARSYTVAMDTCTPPGLCAGREILDQEPAELVPKCLQLLGHPARSIGHLHLAYRIKPPPQTIT